MLDILQMKNFQSFAGNGVVGNVALQFFDSEGKREKFQGFNERVAGMPADQIKKIRNRNWYRRWNRKGESSQRRKLLEDISIY